MPPIYQCLSAEAIHQLQCGAAGLAPRILVAGDVMLDRNYQGPATRLAPEGPIPVVINPTLTCAAGGAANVAANVAALGGIVKLVGLVGYDLEAEILENRLKHHEVECHLIYSSSPTITKTRIYAGNQLTARYDREVLVQSPEVVTDKIMQLLDGCDLLILSDYGKGCLPDHGLPDLISAAHQRGVFVLVDPKGADFSRYWRADLITPNLPEACIACGQPGPYPVQVNDEAAVILAQQVSELSVAGAVCLKRGPAGMTWYLEENFPWRSNKESMLHLPAWHPQKVFDAAGAGDTFLAALAVGFGMAMTVEESSRFAAIAAGLAVGQLGAAIVQRGDVNAVMLGRQDSWHAKILSSLAHARRWRQHLKDKGHELVFTNGCFDLLHPGHLALLDFAASKGNALLVAVNTDESIQLLKGITRPIIPLAQRLYQLASLSVVDRVLAFNEDTPLNLIEALRPEVLVKGSSTLQPIVGSAIMEGWNGRLELAPMVSGWSTTDLIEKIRLAA